MKLVTRAKLVPFVAMLAVFAFTCSPSSAKSAAKAESVAKQDGRSINDKEGTAYSGEKSTLLRFEMKAAAGNKGPSTLYLWVHRTKEYPPFFWRASGTAYVTTRADGGDRFPVDFLSFRIEINCPSSGVQHNYREANNVSDIGTSVECAGAAEVGEFKAKWLARATHTGFGTWYNDTEW